MEQNQTLECSQREVGILNAVLTDAISRFEEALISMAEAQESESSPDGKHLSVVGQVPDLPLPALAGVLKAHENDDQLEHSWCLAPIDAALATV